MSRRRADGISPSPLWGEGRGEGRVLAIAHVRSALRSGTGARLAPHPNPLPGGKRGPTCRASTSPSPLWGEGRGEGRVLAIAHVRSALRSGTGARLAPHPNPLPRGERGPTCRASTSPSPLRGEGWGEGRVLVVAHVRSALRSGTGARLAPHPNPLPRGERGPTCRASTSPSPLRGEGWGEGRVLAIAHVRSALRSGTGARLAPHPNPLPKGERGQTYRAGSLVHGFVGTREYRVP